MRNKLKYYCLCFCFLMTLLAIGMTPKISIGAGTKAIAEFNDWSAHQTGSVKNKICYMHGEPKKSTGKYRKRGATYLQVAHRKKERIKNEVSVTAGYTYKKNSGVEIEIKGKRFSLYTNTGTAWVSEASKEAELVAAMMAGKIMIITGISSRGTRTKDRYSLSGFTAAYNKISKSCGIK